MYTKVYEENIFSKPLNMKIVIIDDQQFNVQTIRDALHMNGYTDIECFTDVDELLDYSKPDMSSPKIDLVLMDVHMPKMNGINLCKTLKMYEKFKYVPILLITAYDEEEVSKQAFEAGAFDYIRKPVIVSELHMRVKRALEQKETFDKLRTKTINLGEMTDLFNTMFSNNLDAMFRYDTKGVIIEANLQAAQLLGSTLENLIGKDITKYFFREPENNLDLLLKEQAYRFSSNVTIGTEVKELEVITIPVVFHEEVSGGISIVKDLTIERTYQKTIESELESARKLQMAILSPDFFDEHLEIRGKYISSTHLSGDLYYWVKIDETKYGIMLIDVVGHGVASSIVCISTRSLMKGMISKVIEPIGVMNELQRHAFTLFNDKSYYFTALYILVDTEKQTLEYINAGHPPAVLHYDKDTSYSMARGGMPVGLIESFVYEKEELPIKEGSKLFLYTDGLLDIWGDTSDECEKQVADILKKVDYSSEEFLKYLAHHVAETEHPDDVTAVTVDIISMK